ncbi:hypothetical protein KSS87_010432 [Heliosperma pusillum]|nr:hypothetical protein KSS87_010432 [Heliosperma pusillum]
MGHKVEKCYLLVGFPPKNGKGNGESYPQKGFQGNTHRGGQGNFKKSANSADLIEEFSPLDDDDHTALASTSHHVQGITFDSSMINGLSGAIKDLINRLTANNSRKLDIQESSDVVMNERDTNTPTKHATSGEDAVSLFYNAFVP